MENRVGILSGLVCSYLLKRRKVYDSPQWTAGRVDITFFTRQELAILDQRSKEDPCGTPNQHLAFVYPTRDMSFPKIDLILVAVGPPEAVDATLLADTDLPKDMREEGF